MSLSYLICKNIVIFFYFQNISKKLDFCLSHTYKYQELNDYHPNGLLPMEEG